MLKNKNYRKVLDSCIEAICKEPNNYLVDPGKNFSRNRKITMKDVFRSVLTMEDKSLTNELMNYFNHNNAMPTASAFIQQRAKIKCSAFEKLFYDFTSNIDSNDSYHGYNMYAVDGTKLTVAPNPNDSSYLIRSNYRKDIAMLHLNALYNINNQTYTDALIQKCRESNEISAFIEMFERNDFSNQKALFVGDRAYGAYNLFAHIQEKNQFFLVRIKDAKTSIMSHFKLSDEEYDFTTTLHLTRNHSKETKLAAKNDRNIRIIENNCKFDYLPLESKNSNRTQSFDLNMRFVRFKLSDTTYETIATNLDANEFPVDEIKKLYAMRWGIETSFRDLKYTLGLNRLHSKKLEFIYQEIYARLTMFNFCKAISMQVKIKKDKKHMYIYKINFTKAVSICIQHFLGKMSLKATKEMIAKYISPVRPDRTFKRNVYAQHFTGFLYRFA